MKPCLLCLEINTDILDCILVNTTLWQELEIATTIAKHFWPLNTTEPDSYLCLTCWREVASFHKFYLRIEEAHMNLSEIKIEDDELNESNTEFGFSEPGMQIEQENQWDYAEPEIITAHSPRHELVVLNTEKTMDIDDDVPLKVTIERLTQSDLESEDPLEKPNKDEETETEVFETKVPEEKTSTEDVKVDSKLKNKLSVLTDNYNYASDVSDKSHKGGIVATERKRRGVNHPNREENDKFIAEHMKKMTCDLCKIPLQDFADMQKHFSGIHKRRGYLICCKRKFSNRTRLVDHLHCHFNPDLFKCKECGKTMSDRVKFNNHILVVHRADEVVKQHRCDICGKYFREAYVLRTHRLTHLPEEEKKFPCSDCGKRYGSSFLLRQHRQVVHLKRFVKVCHICGKGMNSYAAHMKKHEGVKPPAIPPCIIHCDVCGLRLTTGERGLKMHKETQHPVGGKKEHPCPFCDRISPTARALKKHIYTMHEIGYDHKCNMCEKAFKRAESLKEHMASHAGTPLYSCRWCPKTFYSNCNMHSHHKNKHPKEYLELKLQKYSFPPVS